MNDKCAAGTGRFLEIMAASLGIPLSEFGDEALKGTADIKVNSMCTVFAESEVISLKNHGASPRDIGRAVHLSVVERLAAMCIVSDAATRSYSPAVLQRTMPWSGFCMRNSR